MTEPGDRARSPHPGGDEPITVFVISWGRPIYLWACLDALYRRTRSAARFVLLDNAHPDPQVGEVIRGFERRGMFSEVVRFETNSFSNFLTAYRERLEGLGPVHVYIESDTVISESPGCWLGWMRGVMARHPEIGVLGSLIDPSDFVTHETALRITGGDAARAEFLAKLESPERAFLSETSWGELDTDYVATDPPFPITNPPGRLMMLRTDVMRDVGFQLDAHLAPLMRERGLVPALTPRVRHRHLSLLNVFDYLDYDRRARDTFFFSPPIAAP